ncbi:sugar ABC transporter permease [Spirochaetia bacterium]|nr:sugar ABC transporter permease [Spirochaetia bacterium]
MAKKNNLLKQEYTWTAVVTFFLLIVSLVSLYPLIYLLFYSLKNNDEIFFLNPFGFPTHLRFENYVKAVNTFDIPLYFRNSIAITGMSIVGILALSLPFAYATARMRWKLRDIASTYMTLGLFIPIQVIMIPLSILVNRLHLANTYFVVVVPFIAFNLAFSSLILSTSLRSIPYEMEESAFMDGAGPFRCFFSIITPLVKPAVATVVIFAFLNVWNEYTVSSILITRRTLKTLTIGLASFVGERSTDWGAMGASLVLASIPTIVIYLIFSEQVEKALTVGGAVKG